MQPRTEDGSNDEMRLVHRAQAAMGLGRPEVAELQIRELLAASPDHPWALAALAHCRALQGDFLLASELVEQAAELTPQNAYVIWLRTLLHSADDPSEAINCARSAVELDPGNVHAWFGLACQYEAFASVHETEKAARHCLELERDHRGAIALLARCRLRFGHPDEAVAILESVLATDPEDADVHRLLGNIAARRDRFADARGHFARAIMCGKHDLETKNSYLNAVERSSWMYRILGPLLGAGRFSRWEYKTILLIFLGTCVSPFLVMPFQAASTFDTLVVSSVFAIPMLAWIIAVFAGDRLLDCLTDRESALGAVRREFRSRPHLRKRELVYRL